MTDTERFDFKLSSGGENRKTVRKKITLKNIFEEIDNRTLPEDVKSRLKNKAENYPHQALNLFFLSIDRHISEEIKKSVIKNDVKQDLEFPE